MEMTFLASKPCFEVIPVNDGCHVVNDGGKTIALVSSQGSIDWLIRSPIEPGHRISHIEKETHLSYVQGLKIDLVPPHPHLLLRQFDYQLAEDGSTVTLIGDSRSEDGKFEARAEAELSVCERGARYEWLFRSTLACLSKEPVDISGIEFTNVYPGGCGGCFLYAPQKKFTDTLMTDREGSVWRFPHQHTMHYSPKIEKLRFAKGTLAGFFGESTGSPVVEVRESTLEPDWAICDMYFDLHCLVRVPKPLKKGHIHRYEALIRYLSDTESRALLQRARPIQITDQDRRTHDFPRLDLGLNRFINPCHVDRLDDCSVFRTAPPQRAWDRQVGHETRGALRITNDKHETTVWSAVPPSQIPNRRRLRITGKIKTQNVEGEGMFLRVRYHTFVWHPEPHVEWARTIQSTPVTGTSDGWVEIALPALDVPEEHFDYLIWLDLVLDGKGVGWLTDLDIDLGSLPQNDPVQAEGSTRGQSAQPQFAASVSPAGSTT